MRSPSGIEVVATISLQGLRPQRSPPLSSSVDTGLPIRAFAADGSGSTDLVTDTGDDPAGGQNFEAVVTWNGRVYWHSQRSLSDGRLMSCKTDGTDLQELHVGDGSAGPDWVVASGTGFEWV